MRILCNDHPRELPDDATIATLLSALELRPELVAVELNRDLVPRDRRATTRLAEGDRVEVVTLVGGG